MDTTKTNIKEAGEMQYRSWNDIRNPGRFIFWVLVGAVLFILSPIWILLDELFIRIRGKGITPWYQKTGQRRNKTK